MRLIEIMTEETGEEREVGWGREREGGNTHVQATAKQCLASCVSCAIMW